MHHRPLIPCAMAITLVTGALSFTGCSRGRGDEAKAQYARTIDALKSGSLSAAYSIAMPPSYDKELNDVLARARSLLGDAELEKVKAILAKAGPKLAPLLAIAGRGKASLAVLAEKLKDAPKALGLADPAAFRSRDAKGLLAAIDGGLFADIAKAEDVKEALSRVEVTVRAEKGDWAQLLFTAHDKDGKTTTFDTVDVVDVNGRFVPDSWAAEWPQRMDALRSAIADVEERKKADPNLILEQLGSLEKMLDQPGPLLEDLVGKFGGAMGAPQAPVEPEKGR